MTDPLRVYEGARSKVVNLCEYNGCWTIQRTPRREHAGGSGQRGSVGSETVGSETVAARFSGSEVQWGGRFGEVVGRVWGARQAGAGAHAGSGGRGPGGTEGARVAGTPAIRGGRGGLKEAPGGWRVEECTERGGGVLGVRGAGGR